VTWSADGGTLSQGSGPASAVWAPNTKARGVFTIQARVAASGETADCTTQIAVTDSLTRGGNETLTSTRTLLAPDAQEAAGYGLYSYILFAARPTDQDRDLFEAILKSAPRPAGQRGRAGEAVSGILPAVRAQRHLRPDCARVAGRLRGAR
jgi:hypothetical protein